MDGEKMKRFVTGGGGILISQNGGRAVGRRAKLNKRKEAGGALSLGNDGLRGAAGGLPRVEGSTRGGYESTSPGGEAIKEVRGKGSPGKKKRVKYLIYVSEGGKQTLEAQVNDPPPK